VQRTRGGSQAGLSGERGQNEVYPVREGREIRAKGRKWSCLVGGEEERYSDRVQQGGGNGSESCFVAARNRNGDKKGT